MDLAINITTLLSNLIIIFGAAAVLFEGRKFLNERKYARLERLYALVNELIRQEMAADSARHAHRPFDFENIARSRDALKNYFFDNMYALRKDDITKQLLDPIDDEAANYRNHPNQTQAREFRDKLNKVLEEAP